MVYRLYPSPNDSPRDGTIHDIAQTQLRHWQDIAYDWPTFDAAIHGREGVQCGRCSQTIFFRSDMGGNKFQYTAEQTQALMVAHIRQRHAEDDSGDN
jgi:hypothetical protein